MNYGHAYEKCTASVMQKMCSKLDGERQDIRTWAAQETKKKMLKTATNQDMRFGIDRTLVRTFKDIYTSWTEDCDDANARKMYMVLYGGFEGSNAAWSKNLEREYMEKRDRECINEDEDRGKQKIGCYEKQITGAKTTQVKLLNRTGCNEKRGKSIQMSNPGKEGGNAKARRKKGDFYVKNLTTVSTDTLSWGQN